MKNDQQDSTVETSARRRLIRGAFAVPAVMTLHSGGARAATSLGMCLVKANNGPATFAATASDDGIFRYRLWVVKDSSSVILSSWIKGADLTVYVRQSQTPFVPSGSWQQFNPGTNLLVGSVTPTAPAIPTGGSFTQTGSWVSLRVSATGKIVSAGASAGGSGVGDSCWNSFATGTT